MNLLITNEQIREVVEYARENLPELFSCEDCDEIEFSDEDGSYDPDVLPVYEELRRGEIGPMTRDYVYTRCGRIL